MNLINEFFVRQQLFAWPKKFGEIEHMVLISSTLNARIFRTNIILAAFFQLHEHRKTTFVRKICTFNVDEIDGWSSLKII